MENVMEGTCNRKQGMSVVERLDQEPGWAIVLIPPRMNQVGPHPSQGPAFLTFFLRFPILPTLSSSLPFIWNAYLQKLKSSFPGQPNERRPKTSIRAPCHISPKTCTPIWNYFPRSIHVTAFKNYLCFPGHWTLDGPCHCFPST